jgi:RHS repeat-associated protein
LDDIYEKKNGTGKYYYIATDALGSINMIVNANDGTITSDMSYDAWGRRRNPYDWSYNNITTSNITDRGFTMHEMLDNFDLINMNGRAYDPLLGQFLSPDPFVSHPENPQGYNRYAYCLNNPLKYTDPSGYMNWKVWTNRNRKFDEAWDRMLVLNYESGFNTEYSRQLEQRVSGYKTMKEWEYKKYIMKQTASGRFKSGNVPMYGGQSTNSPNGNNNSGFGPGDGWLPGIWISGPVKNEKGPDWINDPSLKYTENYQSNGWDFCSSNLISFITGIGLKEIHYSTTSYASQELAKSKDLRIMFTNYMLGKTPAANYWFSPTITDPETYLPSLRAHFNALRTSIVCLFVGTMEIKDVKKFDDQTFLLTIKNDLGFSTLGYHLASKDKDWGNGRYFEPPLSKVTQIYHILYHYKP